MRRLPSWTAALALAFALSLFATAADAAKPRDDNGDFLGNGFPSGEHFNLNLLGKKDNFTCPAPKWEITSGEHTSDPDGHDHAIGDIVQGESCPDGHGCNQVFGSVIFMPRQTDDPDQPGTEDDDISFLVESGRKGPKSKPGTSVLEVTDWCTESFPDDGSAAAPGNNGDEASFRLRKDPEGYAVFGRITGKPTEGGEPSFDFTSRSLELVEDEFGNDLLLLGLVTSEGVFDAAGVELTRFDSNKKGKGVKKAVDLSSLFWFNGEVCFINDDGADEFCPSGPGFDGCELRTDDATGLELPVCCVAVDDTGTPLTPETDGSQCVDAATTEGYGFALCQDNASLVEADGNTVGDEAGLIGDGSCDPGEDCEFACVSDLEEEDLSATPIGNGDGTCDDQVSVCNTDNDGDGICETDETCSLIASADDICAVVPLCKDFSVENGGEGVWIFNIAAFVNVLFGVDNNGSFNVQLRFYPLPLDIDAQTE